MKKLMIFALFFGFVTNAFGVLPDNGFDSSSQDGAPEVRCKALISALKLGVGAGAVYGAYKGLCLLGRAVMAVPGLIYKGACHVASAIKPNGPLKVAAWIGAIELLMNKIHSSTSNSFAKKCLPWAKRLIQIGIVYGWISTLPFFAPDKVPVMVQLYQFCAQNQTVAMFANSTLHSWVTVPVLGVVCGH